MYSLGLRNEEACGVKFDDIIPIGGYKDCYMLRVYTAINSKREETTNLKTRNAYRYIPIPEALMTLLNARKEYIQEKHIIPDSEIIKYPIAGKGEDHKKRCTTRDLTEAGKYVLNHANVDGRELAYIELSKDSLDLVIYEKDPTAYLLRRNFGTMMHLMDLTQNEIEYIIGHEITSAEKSRNYFTNPDLLYGIKRKMDNRPYFSSKYLVDNSIILETERTVYIDTPYKQNIVISPKEKNCKIILNLQAKKPNDNITVTTNTDSEVPINVELYSTAVERNKNDHILSVLRLVHKVYGSIK